MAAPLLAEPRVITMTKDMYTMEPIGLDDPGPRDYPGAFHKYDSLVLGGPPTLIVPPVYQTGTSWSNFLGDDLQSTHRSFTHFHWVYFDSRIGPLSQTVYHSSLIGFSCDPNPSSASFGGALQTASGIYSAVFYFTGLPGATAGNPAGGWLFSIVPGAVTVLAPGNNYWMWMANTEQPGFLGYGARMGVPAVGATHDFVGSSFSPFMATPTASFFTITHTAYPGVPFNLRMATGIPEPVTLLLAAGGLLVLRRRR
jgi:hypothetical protein